MYSIGKVYIQVWRIEYIAGRVYCASVFRESRPISHYRSFIMQLIEGEYKVDLLNIVYHQLESINLLISLSIQSLVHFITRCSLSGQYYSQIVHVHRKEWLNIGGKLFVVVLVLIHNKGINKKLSESL